MQGLFSVLLSYAVLLGGDLSGLGCEIPLPVETEMCV